MSLSGDKIENIIFAICFTIIIIILVIRLSEYKIKELEQNTKCNISKVEE